jgi:membrane-bound lytic murein transglycosylase D
MRMKINPLYTWTLGSLVLASSIGCQTAKKPAASAPALPKAAPPIQASASAQRPQPAPTHAKPAQPEVQSPVAKQIAEPKAVAKSDPVGDLIAHAEAEYQAGQQEYSAGHNDLAKQHFTLAFNLMMGSSAELHSDPRFQPEFDRVLSGMNKLEFAALQQQQSETEPEQKAEPAPIDEANEVTNYPVDPNLKAKATEEIKTIHSDLPLMMTDQVAGYINYFSNRGRGTLEHGLQRSGRYREMIERVLKEEGVPQDLIYLAQAESGFHPYAVSRAGARGIWQFMGSRARAYSLHRDVWMDERQDPEKSTRAAARHLKDLYNQFGDWYLAMAAYNSGPGTVQSAVKRTGYADFWELYNRNVLPHETRNYVPIIVAVTIMAKNPEQYGLESIAPDPAIAYDTVKINYPVDLRLVAQCVDSSADDLMDLNPALLRTVTPKGRFELHLPVGTAEKFQSAIASIPPDMRVWWRYHKVQDSETLMSVARSYHTSVRTLAEANQLDTDAQIEAGAKLVVPIAPGGHSSEVQSYAKRLTVYHVRKGDSVQTVADNLGIPPTTLRRWNHLKSDSLSGRRILYVRLPVTPSSVPAEHYTARKSSSGSHLVAIKSKGKIHHTVRRGETLYSIANSYRTSVQAIKQTNANVATLRPGMVLVIPRQ